MFNFFKREAPKINEPQPPPADVIDVFAKYAGNTTHEDPTTTGEDNNEEKDKNEKNDNNEKKDNNEKNDNNDTAAAAQKMNADQFRRFLMEYQEERESECERIVQQVFNQGGDHPGLTVDEFLRHLLDDDLNGPMHTEVHHEMTAPLQHYFIFTGHNSYLTGNQLSSDCSDVPIIKALQRGVRVIELDLWPDPSKDDIHVVHGRTLTTPVSFRKCLTSIKDYAFERSPYPVIIDLEDHLTPKLQAKVVEMVTEIFGDMIYYSDSNIVELPSPEDLKHRVLLSASPPEDPPKDESLQEIEDDDKSIISDYDDVETQEVSYLEKDLEYKQLIAIHSCKPKGGLRRSLATDRNVHCLNLSEGALKRAVTNYSTNVLRFTPHNLVRVYPNGTRVESSNYHPMDAWTHGAQMVAFNMQGYDKPLWLMHGMFKANGGCGYIKKPDFLMENEPHPENIVFNPKAHNGVKTTLKVRVYMGDGWYDNRETYPFDAFSPPDFYTKLRLQGVQADCDKKQTNVIHDKWVPIWNEEFSFKLTVPELALLRFEVGEYDMFKTDDFAGQTCLPISEIKPGIRSVPLFDIKGDRLPNVRLLISFQFIPNSS